MEYWKQWNKSARPNDETKPSIQDARVADFSKDARQQRRMTTPGVDASEAASRPGDAASAARRMIVVSLLCLSLLNAGCNGSLFGHRNQYGPPPSGASKAEIFRYLNANIAKMYSWRSTNVIVQARSGLPLRLSGHIAVESPRNFRMKVTSMAGDEADFGSNPQEFWFWMRRSEPRHVFTCRHDDMAQAARKLPLPFQPDWLIEVLGVIPLDESQFTVENTDSRNLTVTLSSEQLSPSGQPVKRLLVVDAQHGVILGHSLFDVRGQLIAKATLKNYRYNTQARVNFPHSIDLDWPQAGMAMTLTVGRDVEINPANLPQQTFEQPQMPGYPALDLGR